PRPTLFPYTTLFRSCSVPLPGNWRSVTGCGSVTPKPVNCANGSTSCTWSTPTPTPTWAPCPPIGGRGTPSSEGLPSEGLRAVLQHTNGGRSLRTAPRSCVPAVERLHFFFRRTTHATTPTVTTAPTPTARMIVSGGSWPRVW